jgi:polyhydroxyalkanoate synthesis regulator phasin
MRLTFGFSTSIPGKNMSTLSYNSVTACRAEREEAKRVIEEIVRRDREEKDRLIKDVNEWPWDIR